MGTAKRERQKAGRAQRLEEARVAQERAKRRNNFLWLGGLAVLVVVVIAVSYLRPKDNTDTSASTTTAAPTSSAPTLPTVAPGATITGPTPCPAADGSSPRTTTFSEPPPLCIDATKAYTAKVSTTKGDFTITLDAQKAPNTVNNFVVLSRYHFYDGIPFHRVVPDFVIQTGDPLGNPPGSGGPGYKFNDELPTSVDEYQPGSVAMANSGPNTNGSQWFVWVGPQKLPSPAYSLFGMVTEGEDTTIQAIIKGGVPGQDTPVDPTTINDVLIGEDGVYPPAPATTTTTASPAGLSLPPSTPTTADASVPSVTVAPPAGAGAEVAPTTTVANAPVTTAPNPPPTTPAPSVP